MAFKIVCTGDVHLKTRDPYDIPSESRLERRLKNLDVCIKRAIDWPADMFVCMGDSFDHPEPSSKLRAEIDKRIAQLVMAGIGVRWLIGNHESIRTWHALMPEQEIFGPLIIIDTITDEKIEDLKVFYVPYLSEQKGEIHKQIEKLTKEKGDILIFGHFGVTGAKRLSGQENMFDLDSEVKREQLAKFKHVYIGHYHIPQYLDNITIVGSLVRNNFGEMGYMPRGLMIEIEGSYVTHRDITLHDINFVKHELSDTNSLIPKPMESGVYQYTLNGTTSWIAETSKMLIAYSTAHNRIDIRPKPTDRKQDAERPTDLKIENAIGRYVDELPDAGSRDYYYKKGLELLNG